MSQDLDSLQLYNIASAAALAIQAIPMVLTPQLVVWLIQSEPRGVTGIETFLTRSLASALLLLAFITLLLTGQVHRLYSSDPQAHSGANLEQSPYAKPTVYATLIFHAAYGVMMYTYSYSRYLSGPVLSLGAAMHLALAAGAMLLILFGAGPGHVSKRTGADKRTSGFPFKNSEADKRKVR